jgi:lysyl-tRNA synthetase class 2
LDSRAHVRSRPFGIGDVFLMNWRPKASISILQERTAILKKIRHFFDTRKYLEVETPYMAHHGVTDLHLQNIEAKFRGQQYYLQTSPEYHMKRLLAAGSGPIYQIARVFRDDELGRWHNPEFSLLEWYQLDVDHWYLIQEIQELFQELAGISQFKHLSYQQAFLQACDFDPLIANNTDARVVCQRFDLENVLSPNEDFDQYLHLLMAMVVEPYLAQKFSEPVVVYDFPASQASLAQVNGRVSSRFEIYWQGVELANGFHELTDEKVQRQRFLKDLDTRQKYGRPVMDLDESLLSALDFGLPPCSGVALGLDRLIALILKQERISQTMSFAFPEI